MFQFLRSEGERLRCTDRAHKPQGERNILASIVNEHTHTLTNTGIFSFMEKIRVHKECMEFTNSSDVWASERRLVLMRYWVCIALSLRYTFVFILFYFLSFFCRVFSMFRTAQCYHSIPPECNAVDSAIRFPVTQINWRSAAF